MEVWLIGTKDHPDASKGVYGRGCYANPDEPFFCTHNANAFNFFVNEHKILNQWNGALYGPTEGSVYQRFSDAFGTASELTTGKRYSMNLFC